MTLLAMGTSLPARVWKQCSQSWLEGWVHVLGATGRSYSTVHTENQRSRPGVRGSQDLGHIDESSSGRAQFLKAFCSHPSPRDLSLVSHPCHLTTYPLFGSTQLKSVSVPCSSQVL